MEIGDDEAAVDTLGSGLDAGDDAALDYPTLGGVVEFTVATDLFRPAVEAADGGILGEIADLAQQHAVAGEAEDVADALALAPCHRLGPAVMAVAAHQNLDRRPAGTDAAMTATLPPRRSGPHRPKPEHAIPPLKPFPTAPQSVRKRIHCNISSSWLARCGFGPEMWLSLTINSAALQMVC